MLGYLIYYVIHSSKGGKMSISCLSSSLNGCSVSIRYYLDPKFGSFDIFFKGISRLGRGGLGWFFFF